MSQDGSDGPVARWLGGCLGILAPIYFTVGMAYGELQAWRDMGCASLISPATQFYVVWYSLTWPYQMFRGSGDPVIRGSVIGFAIVSDAKETYLTNGCKRFTAQELGWNDENLLNIRTAGGHVVREGSAGGRRIAVLEFEAEEHCEYELGRLAGAYEAGTTSFEGLYSRALTSSR